MSTNSSVGSLGLTHDPSLGPARDLLREQLDVARRETERLKREIDARHAEMKRLGEEQDRDAKALRDRQIEQRAYERVLHQLSPGRGTAWSGTPNF